MCSENKSNSVSYSFCQECGRPIAGRPDKLFCSDACRWRNYSNRVNLLMKRHSPVLESLEANYCILESLVARKSYNISIDEVKAMGFDPAYITWSSKRTHTVCRCFDIEYCVSATKIFNIHIISNPLEELFPPEDIKLYCR